MNFNIFDQCLYKLAFATKKLQLFFSEYEIELFKSKIDKQVVDGMVFICGLPRSGTTILLESLYATGMFVTHKYSHLPFIYTPIFWSYLSKKITTKKNKIERMHGDGIYINNSSPEAFEEMLWESFNKKAYQSATLSLWEEQESPLFSSFFTEHVKKLMVLEGGHKSLYLSKNNANIVRLSNIKNSFPSAKILILYREPLQHSFSLLTQHRKFLKLHGENAFYSQYMEGIAHYDFGVNFKPIDFNHWLSNNPYQPTELNFWLLYWLNSYTYLFESYKRDCYFSSFECINKTPQLQLLKIKKYLSLNQLEVESRFFKIQKEHLINEEYSYDLLLRCSTLYDEINSYCKNV